MSQISGQPGSPLWPRWAGAITTLLSVVALVLALVLLVQSAREGLASGIVEAWFACAFAVVMLTGCVMGVLTGVGKLRGAEPMTLLCVGGMLFVSAILSNSSFVTRLMGSGGSAPVFAGMNMQWVMLGLLVVGFSMMGLSAITTLRRDPRSAVPIVAKGVAFGAPILAMGALWKIPSTRAMIQNLPGWAVTLLALIALVVLVICASGCIHLLIRGFGVAAHRRAPGSAQPPDSDAMSADSGTPMEGGAGVAQQ